MINEYLLLLDVTTLNQFLWRHDLMGTGCNLMDEMEHEYWALADGICQRVKQGEGFSYAVTAEFEEAFWPGCLADAVKQERFSDLLMDIQTHLSRQGGV